MSCNQSPYPPPIDAGLTCENADRRPQGGRSAFVVSGTRSLSFSAQLDSCEDARFRVRGQVNRLGQGGPAATATSQAAVRGVPMSESSDAAVTRHPTRGRCLCCPVSVAAAERRDEGASCSRIAVPRPRDAWTSHGARRGPDRMPVPPARLCSAGVAASEEPGQTETTKTVGSSPSPVLHGFRAASNLVSGGEADGGCGCARAGPSGVCP
jgi:hypothetical protein